MLLQPLLGIPVLVALAWLLSTDRKAVRWRPLLGGLLLQFLLALVVLRTRVGAAFFDGAQAFFLALIEYAKQGSRSIFGDAALGLADGPPLLAVLVVVTVVFFSSLFAVLHHLGVVRLIVGGMARLMARTLGTSGAESTSAAANIFVGQTEAPLLIRPYLAGMTISEVGAVMSVGFATVAGGVFAIYVGMLSGTVPGVAGHLLAASVMSAPMALGLAKVVFPETDRPATLGVDVAQPRSSYVNLVDAAASGAGDGMQLSINILGMLIAFLAILQLLNGLLGMIDDGLTLQRIFGWLLAPVAWLLGVPAPDAQAVGGLLGTKIAVNEYVAYDALAKLGAAGEIDERSRIVASYALCGFANFSSIAIQIGGLSGMAPERRGDFARLGLRAMLTGALASFCTAATAAILL
ncbi:MAG: NupC/NupG family nucleoside CNT transporter [Planctomycetota bacterium]|nr:MAG: NupC/NupG family nucleoside CNT transporter [Planctomycetota bacterium]